MELVEEAITFIKDEGLIPGPRLVQAWLCLSCDLALPLGEVETIMQSVHNQSQTVAKES